MTALWSVFFCEFFEMWTIEGRFYVCVWMRFVFLSISKTSGWQDCDLKIFKEFENCFWVLCTMLVLQKKIVQLKIHTLFKE